MVNKMTESDKYKLFVELQKIASKRSYILNGKGDWIFTPYGFQGFLNDVIDDIICSDKITELGNETDSQP